MSDPGYVTTSAGIAVPLDQGAVVVGDRDRDRAPGVCTSASLLACERLRENAPETNAAILRWVRTAAS